MLVFIPGNPGLIDYYTTYLELISEANPQFSVLAISHAGHQSSDDFVKAGKQDMSHFYSIDFQIQHKFEILKREVLNGHNELHFLAHSVGGYVVQRVVKQLLEDPELAGRVRVKFVGLICPTIVDIAKSLSGVRLTRLVQMLPLVQLAIILITILQWILPDSVALWIIRSFIIARPASDDARLNESWSNAINGTMKIYKLRRIVQQTLLMAVEEMEVIHKDDAFNDWFFEELPKTQNVRLWSFFAIKDHWVHDNTRDYILGRYHDLESKSVRFEVGDVDNDNSKAITHSFCIDQSVEFAAITCQALGQNGSN